MTDETKRVAREPTAAIEQMLARDGLYVVGDTDFPGAVLPIAVIEGEAYAWVREATPLRRSGWNQTATVYCGPPYAAPAAAPSDRERRLHEALRARVIDSRRCYQCHTEQAFNEPERHTPGCLAAPLPQDGE